MALRHFPFLAALIVCGLIGCSKDATTTSEDTAASQDDHAGHDHHGHDQSEHESDTIKPGELGLNVDDLPGSVGPPMPESFSDAVDQVSTLVAKVSVGLANDDVDSVHDELHDLGNALENAKSLAKSSGQSDDVTSAVNQLFDSFSAIDAKLHGEEGKDFSEVKDDIDAAVKALKTPQEN